MSRDSKSWFEADKGGLAQIARRNGLAFIGYELVQNALDTGARTVTVDFEPVPGSPKVWIHVTDDDPDGFKNLDHAYTLYAPSEKAGDPAKRGFMNRGEKLVLAVCDEAHIVSTKGSIHFTDEGRTKDSKKRPAGTKFSGLIRMTRAELTEVVQALALLLPPPDREVTFDGARLPTRTPLHTFSATLKTVMVDTEGLLRSTSRMTEVRIYEPIDGTPRLYEMGIPVVEIDLPWTVEVMQKVPVNADRNNVTAGYAKDLAVLVVNEMHKFLKPDDASLPGVQAALSDSRISNEAVTTIVQHQFGEKCVVRAPGDPEANAKAFHEGFTVVPGSAFSKDQWEQVRRADVVPPATRFFASPKLYSDDPEAQNADTIPEAEWSPGMRNVAAYAVELGERLMKMTISVRFERRFGAIDAANYGKGGHLCFNVSKIGYKWFDQGITKAVNDLLIHEFAHESGSHLEKAFDDAMSRLGAALWDLAMCEPEFFRKYGYSKV